MWSGSKRACACSRRSSRTEDAFSKFEILERRADFAEGRADALGMTGPKSLEEEIAELKAAEAVDKELEAMKAALKARGK
jgi:phage shock protein A